jgi:hypothetical protein
MTNLADPGFAGPALSELSYRIVHSHLIDFIDNAPPKMREYVLEQLRGRRTVAAMMRAIDEKRLKPDVFIDDETDEPVLELGVMAGDGMPLTIVELDGPAIGVHPDDLMREQQYRLDQALLGIRGGAA